MQESTESSPGTATAETETPGTESRLQTLAQAFEEQPGTAEPDKGDEGKPAGDGTENGKPTKFNDLAGRLGVELDDLYKLEIATAKDGNPVTVEQLKDIHAKQDEFAVSQLEWEETRQKREGELIRAQNELKELVASLPKNAIKPEVLDAVRQKHEQTLKRERAETLKAIPAWADEDKRTEDISGMIEHLKGYGFPESYLTSVSDHRVIQYIRENWQRETRLRKALEQVKTASPGKTSKSKPNGAAPKKPSTSVRPSAQSRDKLAQVFSGL